MDPPEHVHAQIEDDSIGGDEQELRLEVRGWKPVETDQIGEDQGAGDHRDIDEDLGGAAVGQLIPQRGREPPADLVAGEPQYSKAPGEKPGRSGKRNRACGGEPHQGHGDVEDRQRAQPAQQLDNEGARSISLPPLVGEKHDGPHQQAGKEGVMERLDRVGNEAPVAGAGLTRSGGPEEKKARAQRGHQGRGHEEAQKQKPRHQAQNFPGVHELLPPPTGSLVIWHPILSMCVRQSKRSVQSRRRQRRGADDASRRAVFKRRR